MRHCGWPFRTKQQELLLDTERVRDAAMTLSHQRPYREYPSKWVKVRFMICLHTDTVNKMAN